MTMTAIEKYADMDIQIGDYLIKRVSGDGDTDIIFLYEVLSKKGDRITISNSGDKPLGLKFYEDRTTDTIPEYKGCFRHKTQNKWFFRYITANDYHMIRDDFQLCY